MSSAVSNEARARPPTAADPRNRASGSRARLTGALLIVVVLEVVLLMLALSGFDPGPARSLVLIGSEDSFLSITGWENRKYTILLHATALSFLVTAVMFMGFVNTVAKSVRLLGARGLRFSMHDVGGHNPDDIREYQADARGVDDRAAVDRCPRGDDCRGARGDSRHRAARRTSPNRRPRGD